MITTTTLTMLKRAYEFFSEEQIKASIIFHSLSCFRCGDGLFLPAKLALIDGERERENGRDYLAFG